MKKHVIKMILSIIFAMVVLTGCKSYNYVSGKNSANHDADDVSIIQLISNPEKYDGKVVRVIGVGNLEFEGDAVYLSRDDWKNWVCKNGLWIELGDDATSYNVAKCWNGKYVIIEGTFEQESTGHFGMWSGAITDITRYELWEEK